MGKNTLSTAGKRYACFTPEQQSEFDHLSERARRYILFISRGFGKKAAYVAAGYKDSKNASKGAYIMESRIPRFKEFVEALMGHNDRMDAYREDTPISQEIDKRAEEDLDIPIVPAELDGVEDRVRVDELTAEQARGIQFFRQVANGTIKNVKKTTTYDRNGVKTGFKIEETTDVMTRIRARAELERRLGLNDLLQIGQISAGSITINIVDARKRDDLPEEQPEVIDGGKLEIVEEVENGSSTETE